MSLQTELVRSEGVIGQGEGSSTGSEVSARQNLGLRTQD